MIDPFANLSEDNILLYMMKCYNTPNCILSEFDSDQKHIKYVKRLLKKFRTDSELKERLILNHIILLSNVFGVTATTRILFYHIDQKDYSSLKTFLLYLSYLPDIITGIKGMNILTKEIPINQEIQKKLEMI